MEIGVFLFGVFLTVVPLIELRGGLPIAIYAIKDTGSLMVFFTFSLVVLVNILLIFLIFFFLENVHHKFLNFNFYNRMFEKYLERVQKKVDKLEKKKGIFVFITLFLFVGIPFPLTGAYTGTFLAWFLGLDKKKSIVAISLGVFLAGILIFLATNGLIIFFG